MAYLFRLIVFFLAIGASFIASAGDRKAQSEPNPAAACNAYVAALDASSSSTYTGTCTVTRSCPASQDGGTCNELAEGNFVITATGTSPRSYYHYAVNYISYCPDVTPEWNGSTCIIGDPCKVWSGRWLNPDTAGGGWYSGSAEQGRSGVISGKGPSGRTDESFPANTCARTVDGTSCTVDISVAGDSMRTGDYWIVVGNGQFSGKSCDPANTSSPQPNPDAVAKPDSPEYDCAKSGGVPGSVSGVTVCVGPDSIKGGGKDGLKTDIHADGSKTDTATSTKTECTGTSCVTTTTTTVTETNSSGVVVSSVSTATSKTDSGAGEGTGTGGGAEGFCVENASSPLCGSGTFGGTCEAGFTCDGDAVQCATARGTWLSRCDLVPDAATVDYGVGELAGSLPDGAVAESPVDLGSSVASATGPLGGSCISDLTVSLMGRSLTVPFSSLCPYLSIFGMVFLLISGLASLAILRGVV